MQRRRGSFLLGAGVVLATAMAFAGGARLRQGSTPTRVSTLQTATGRIQVAENGHTVTPGTGGAQDFGGTFETVYALVKDQYYDTLPTDTKMAQGSVKLMLAALEDPNSYYLDPDQRKLLESEARGRFAGIGAALSIQSSKTAGYTDYKIVVVAPLPGSPAEKAGLKPGDVITHIDGRWVLGYDPLISFAKVAQQFQNREVDDKAYEKARVTARDRIAGGIRLHAAEMLLRGDMTLAKNIATKEKYTLTLQRKGQATPIKAEVAPGVTAPPVVESKLLDGKEGKAGYIKVPYLTAESSEAVAKALASLPQDGTATGLVLDLRGTPGGSFEAMQQIAGLLVGRGVVVQEVGQGGRKSAVLANESAKVKGPLTVLVDGGTASTAEALASCLSERGGATLVGEKTFGESLVQGMYLMQDGSAFTLATGKLVSGKGVAWAGVGLNPQVAVAAGTPETEVLARAVATLKNRPQIAGTPASGGKG
jgi:carboxyl-terminal processing protease